MSQQATARLPDPVVDALDSAARQLSRSRADVIRQAVDRPLTECLQAGTADISPAGEWLPRCTRGSRRRNQETLAAKGCSAFFWASTSSTVGLPATARSMASLVAW